MYIKSSDNTVIKNIKAREWGDSAKAWPGRVFYMMVSVDLTDR